MKWNKFTITTTTAAEDIVSALLADLGIEGVEIENNVPLTDEETSGMFIDFPPELPPDNGESRVSFYLEDGRDHTELLKKVREALEQERRFFDIGSGGITGSQTEDIDWINNWKRFFTSFTVGDILIKPTWEDLKQEDAGRTLIEIDPGISFGTGKHETTQLCIRELGRILGAKGGGGRVLDVGFGSGILSIVALKLGAESVVGTDIDEACLESVRENLAVNHLESAPAVFYIGNLTDDRALQERVGAGEYDIVVANILADVIIPMAPVLSERLKPGGVLVTSGIIDFKENEVADALRLAGLKILETNRQGEWVGITAQRG